MKKLIAAIWCGLALVAGADSYISTGAQQGSLFRQYCYTNGILCVVTDSANQIVEPLGTFLRQSTVTNVFTVTNVSTVTAPKGYAFSAWVLTEWNTREALPLPQKLSDVVRAATWRTETVAIPGSNAQVKLDHFWTYMLLVPCFDWLLYDLVYRANDGTSAATRQSYRYPDKVTVSEPKARVGYTFQGWAVEPTGEVRFTGDQRYDATDFGVKQPEDAIDLYAVWDKVDLTVALDACGGAVVAPSVTGRVEEPLSLPTPVREGYDFLGWFTAADGGAHIADGSPLPATLKKLYAHWRVAKCVFVLGTANPRGGFVSPSGERAYEPGDTVSFSATPRSGYRFAGWNDGVTAASRTVIATSNVTYWARFEPLVHQVTFVYRTATGEEATEVQLVKDGERAWPPADARCKNWEGHTFESWSESYDFITSDRTVTARYTTDSARATIYYLANGGAGEMQPQVYDRSQPTVLLQENGFTRDGATFLGWSTDRLAATNEVMFADGARVTDPASDGQVALFAVWALLPPETATIHFCANGGSGWMDPVVVTNFVVRQEIVTNGQNVVTNRLQECQSTTLPCCTFESPQPDLVFKGWARTPDAVSAEYGNKAVLQSVSEETLILYAVWDKEKVGPLAASVGVPFDLVAGTNEVWGVMDLWTVTTEIPDADAVDFSTCLVVTNAIVGTVQLEGQVQGSGTLSFFWRKANADNSAKPWFSTKKETARYRNYQVSLQNSEDWQKESVELSASETTEMTSVQWEWEHSGEGALWLGGITWTPTRQTAPINYAQYVVTPRVAVEGHLQTGVAALVGCTVSGDATATLPGTYTATVTLAEGYVWPDGETNAVREVVWEMRPGAATSASWHVREGLSYTGGVQTGVVAVAGCTVTQQTATDAGTYQALVTLLPGGYWPDGMTAQRRQVSWSIAKAAYDMSAVRFTNATVVADGSPKRLTVSGALPDGVSVTYDGNDKTEPGTYTVKAHFTGDAANCEPIADLTATLTIVPPFGSSNQFEPVWEDLPVGAVSFFDQEVVYDGHPHTIDTNALLAAFAPYVPQPMRLEFAESIYSSSWSAQPLTQTDVGRRLIAYRVATANDGWVCHEARLVVLPRALDAATEVTVADQRWTDTAQTPPVSVSVDGQALTEGRDFSVQFTNNVAVGTALVTVTGWGNYTGDCTATFRINRAVYDMRGVRFADATVLADGKPKSLVISGKLPAGVKVSYSGNAQTAPGVYTVTAHFTGDTTTHEPIPDLSAVLTIRDRWHPNGPNEDGPTLYPTDQVAPMDASYAATFSGWLRDANGAMSGLITVKTTKAAAGKPCKSTITVTWLTTGKKQSFKATINPSADDGYPQDEYGLIYTDRAIRGTFKGYTVELSEDFAKSKRADEKALLATMPQGNWAVAFAEDDGYSVFTLTVSKNGKSKIAGTLSDGTKISVSAQGVLGEDGLFAVPVFVAKRTVRLAFVLWLMEDELTVSDVPASWTYVAGGARTPVAGGVHALVMDVPEVRDYLTTVDGLSVLPDTFTVTGNKWNAGKTVGKVKMDKASGLPYLDYRANQTPANVGALKLTFTARTGAVKGSFKLYYLEAGKLKYDTVTLTGAVVEGRLFATGVIKKTAASFRIESE